MAKILIALGGNALEVRGNSTIEEQRRTVAIAAKQIVDLIELGHQIIITHGNGPQVGRILLQNEIAKDVIAPQPLDICGSMTQGYIGYVLQNCLQNELNSRGISKPVATIVTQIVVDKNDAAFQNPTKPIGSFVTENEAKAIMKEKGHIYKEDSGRGWRRVVASPQPQLAVEAQSIKLLIDSGVLTIAAGGGGIPVIQEGTSYVGIEAVIDKDLSAEMLAEQLQLDCLLILTAVEKVAINFGKPDQKFLDTMTIEQAEQYSQEGHFAEGSMLPKVQAAVKFIKNSSNKSAKAIITSLENAKDALEGNKGTTMA